MDLKLPDQGTQHSDADESARSQTPIAAACEIPDDDNVSTISADSVSPLLDDDAKP